MQRPCDFCGQPYEALRKNSRFCETKHRVAYAAAMKTGRPIPAVTQAAAIEPMSTDVADRLERELRKLGVFEKYEAAIVVGMAKQLDSGAMVGTAYVSLSKEVDRRVDALRLKAERPDDPTRVIRERVEEKQAHLRLA